MIRALRRVTSACLLCFSVGALAPCLAFAQKSEAAIAEALFQDGRRLFTSKKYDEACPKFEESYRLAPKLGTLLNLATCHDAQGKTGSAWGELTEAITLAKDANELDRVAYARKLLDDLDQRLSKLVLDVPFPVEGLEVRVDGRPLSAATYRTSLPLDPGTHIIEAKAPGHEPWTKDVDVPKGPSSTVVEVPALVALPSAKPEPSTPPPTKAAPAQPSESSGNGQAVAGWIIGGAGLVGIGVGSVFGLMTFSKQGDSDAFCEGVRCTQEGVDLREGASTTATISTIAFAVGGAAVAGGLVLVLTAGGDTPQAASAYIAPLGSPDGGGLLLGGRF
jgi:hypothetical protein